MIIAIFDENYDTPSICGELWQYDYGQILRIQGLDLPFAVEIHFSLKDKGIESVTRIGVTKDSVTNVIIPDSILENGDIANDYYIYAFVYLRNDESGETTKKIRMTVKARPKPEGYNSEDSTMSAILKAVNSIADGKADGLKYEDNILSLMAGEKSIASVTITGGSGSGTDGREVELQNNGIHIQWRYEGEESWTNLIALEDIKGPAGPAGEKGDPGTITPEQISGAVEEYFASNPIQVGATEEQARQIEKNTQDISKLSDDKVNNPSIGEIGQILEIETVDENGKPKTYKAVDKPTGGGEVSPQWAEFPRETNPARDVYNRTAMDNALELGSNETLRHNAMIESGLITWTESTTSSDTASGSSGGVDVKIKHVYDYFGTAHKQANPWESNYIRYTDDITVFPSGESIYGADGSIIDTVIATSDSTIIDIGSPNYIILAYCRGNSDYHMIYRTASISSHTITLGETINVLTINGVEWDMTTLRSDYTNKLSQLNTKVIKASNVYYMAVVQSKVGIAIMKSSDGIDWSLHAHIADEDAYLEACLGFVSYVSTNMPTYYLVVRHPYGDGYLTLYGSDSLTFEKIISKVFIPAATGRAIIDSNNNKEAYLIYSVNGRKNAVLAKILSNSDGTTGISILETPDNCLSNYPCIYVNRNSLTAFIVGTNGLNNTNNSSVSVSYIWINNTDIEKEKNKEIKKVMFGTAVEVIQTLTEGTEIGSVGGTKLYAPKASASSGGGIPTLELLGTATVSEDTGRVDFEFETALNLKKILVYAHTIGVSDYNGQARGTVYVNDKLVADGFENAAFNSGAERYMLFDIDVLQDCTIGRSYSETKMGSGYSSDRVAFLMKTDINADTDIVKISFLANTFASIAIASGTTISVYGY